MLSRIAIAASATLLLVAPQTMCQTAPSADSALIAAVETSLMKLVQMHREIRGTHSLLNDLHPIAVVEGESWYIFDTDSLHQEYRLQRKEPVPFPLGKGIRASFPLGSYGGKPGCVVSQEVFDTMKGYVTVFHEFVHCSQYLTCENRLKAGLAIAIAAAKVQDYSWEINHPFPYGDSGFVAEYSRQLSALADHDSAAVRLIRRSLTRRLCEVDREYMVWVEWKEGLARFVENRIRSRYGIEPNTAGNERPYSRVTFYSGGEQFIALLTRDDQALLLDPERLFRRMSEYAGAE
jgi:hypothetical protein